MAIDQRRADCTTRTPGTAQGAGAVRDRVMLGINQILDQTHPVFDQKNDRHIAVHAQWHAPNTVLCEADHQAGVARQHGAHAYAYSRALFSRCFARSSVVR